MVAESDLEMMRRPNRESLQSEPEAVAEKPSNGLRQQLRRSHLYLVSMGLGITLVMLVASFWVCSYTLRLAYLRGPTMRTATLALSGIERSMEALREWIQLGDPAFKEARIKTWNDTIWPAITEGTRLSHEWANPGDSASLAEIARLLGALSRVQGRIEETAPPPGDPLRRVMAALPSDRVQVANNLVAAEAIPLARQIRERLEAISENQSVLMGQDAQLVTTVRNLSAGLSLALIAAMLIVARVLVRRSTDRMMQPIMSLLQATQRLTARTLTEDIPVHRGDELGQLTMSFNAMRASLACAEASQRQLSAIVESSHDAIVGTDLDGVIVSWNAGAVKLYGYTADEAIGCHVHLVVPESEQDEVSDLFTRIRQGDAINSFETSRLHKDGSPVEVSLTTSPIKDANGVLVGVSGIARDLTDYRLRQHLAHRNRELDANNRYIRETFGRYVTDEVVASVLDEPGGQTLGGETRKVTMLMSDLRGFTSLAERLPPKRVVALLNRYLETMVNVIVSYQGTIDEIMGDGIFVLFGAPIAREDDAQRAVACAVAMQLAMDDVNVQNRREDLPDLEMGIGIHTGEVVVGNIGSSKRTKYGVVGSHVNLTGRIESYTTGGQILISEATWEAVGSLLRIDGEIQVEPKGVQECLTLYDVRAIGGPFCLNLPEKTETLVPLNPPIELHFMVLEEEFVGRTVFPGRFVKLSCKGAELQSSRSVASLSNLKIRLVNHNGSGVSGAFYGKVIAQPRECAAGFFVRFTSMTPEVSAYLQQMIASRMRPETQHQ